MERSEPSDGRVSLVLTRDELDILWQSVREGTQLDGDEFRIRTGWNREQADLLLDELRDAFTDPRWQDLSKPRPVQHPPREPRELAYRIWARARRVPHGRSSIKITAWAVGSSYGARFECSHPDNPEPVDVTMATDAADLLEELRHATYETGRGGWYNAVIRVDEHVDPRMDLDFDNPPAFPWPISPETYRRDLELFPRKPEHIPAWMPS